MRGFTLLCLVGLMLSTSVGQRPTEKKSTIKKRQTLLENTGKLRAMGNQQGFPNSTSVDENTDDKNETTAAPSISTTTASHAGGWFPFGSNTGYESKATENGGVWSPFGSEGGYDTKNTDTDRTQQGDAQQPLGTKTGYESQNPEKETTQ